MRVTDSPSASPASSSPKASPEQLTLLPHLKGCAPSLPSTKQPRRRSPGTGLKKKSRINCANSTQRRAKSQLSTLRGRLPARRSHSLIISFLSLRLNVTFLLAGGRVPAAAPCTSRSTDVASLPLLPVGRDGEGCTKPGSCSPAPAPAPG